MSAYLPAAVLATFHTNLAAITGASSLSGTLQPSGYRFELSKEPDSALDGRYFVDVLSVEAHRGVFGTGENITAAQVAVNVAYHRGGGDMGGGERETTLRHAGDDAMHIADVLDLSANYFGNTSGLREVRWEGSRRVADLPRGEIWRHDFWAQWRSDGLAS